METLWDTLGGAATGAASTLGGAASTLGGAASAVTAAVIDVTVVADGNNDDGDKDDTVGLLEIEGDDELELVRTYDLDDEDAFSLQTCEMLGEISILIYLEPPFWHSDMEKREDNFANGLAALCPTSRATLGVFTSSDGHALQGMTTPWDLRIHLLPEKNKRKGVGGQNALHSPLAKRLSCALKQPGRCVLRVCSGSSSDASRRAAAPVR